MGDENHIRTLGDYSKPSHNGYRNTINLLLVNNVVPLRSDTIRLVQNGCSFHRLWSKNPNQHLKDFLKLMDSLDLDDENRERTRLRLFQFSLRHQASNWLERLPAGSITTWDDLTTHFLSQFFPPTRTAKLRNDILIWNDPRDFAKPVKAITLPQDVPSTSDSHLIELENQVRRLMEAHLTLTQPTQVNKITTSYEIYNGPYDTQYCMEDIEQAFVEYASSRTDKAGGLVSNFMASQDARLSKFEVNFKQQQSKMTNKIDTVLKAITDRITGALPSDTVNTPKLSTSPILSAFSYPTIDPQCSSHPSTSINAIKTSHIFVLANGTKSYPVRIVKDVEVHIGKMKLLNDFYMIDMKKDPETPLLVGRGFLATANVVIDYRMAKIAVGEGITRSVFRVKRVDLGEEEAPYWTTLRKRESYKPRPCSDGVGVQTPYYARKDFLDCHLPREWEIARDVELNPFKDTLVFRRMVEFLGVIPINLKSNIWESDDLIKNPINWDKPPKDGDGAWHAKIRLINPDGEEFTKTLQSIPTTRKLSERQSPREIIDLDHFYDT
ncbi:MAK10-like protein [Tanacetum coccineum]